MSQIFSYSDADPNCHYCHAKRLISYDQTYEVICRCRTGHDGVEFQPLVKRVVVDDGKPFSPKADETPMGWFHINQNWWGWTISELNDFEKDWFRSQGMSLDGVFRTVSENGHQNIAHFRFDTGTFAFMDGTYYRETDKIRWDKHTPYTKCMSTLIMWMLY